MRQLIDNQTRTAELSHTNNDALGHILQRISKLEKAGERPEAAPDEPAVILDSRMGAVAGAGNRQSQQLHLVEKSIMRVDHDVTRRPGQQQAFGGNNLSGIERAPDGDSPVGSDEIFDVIDPALVRSALGAHDMSQVDVLGSMIVEMGERLADTLNRTLTNALGRVNTGTGGAGDGDGDGSDDGDPPDPRGRSKRGKPRSHEGDDESYEGRGRDSDQGEKSAFDFRSKDRLLRLMDANE
jgi:hypothetical protein